MAGDPRERLGVEASTVSHSGKEGMVTTSAGEAAPESFSRERPETSPGATSIGGPRAGAGAVGAGAAGAGEGKCDAYRARTQIPTPRRAACAFENVDR